MISDFDKILVFIIGVFIALELAYWVDWIILKCIVTPIYCRWKYRHNTVKRCPFWSCKRWHGQCPYGKEWNK